ncbi:MAG: hypothetical protein C4518_12305 [Desulfobacteraceae bacterium]|nr:MAG: hypothetical protein C4518_12305 [Desulfobacteraceae bacterium]
MGRKSLQQDNVVDFGSGCGRTKKTKICSRLILSSCLLLIFAFFTAAALADDHEGKHDSHKKHDTKHCDDKHDDNPDVLPVTNPNYSNECGACHFAYPPGLLPSASWREIVAGLENHFGEEVAIDTESKNILIQYLESNAADTSKTELSEKIMRGIDGQTLLRITELSYIIKKHHDIEPSVFKRPSIGSLSNCAACHKGAETGDFDDDRIVMPK